MKLCTYEGCGEPSTSSRCEAHAYPEPQKRSTNERGYNSAWDRLSRRARQLQPWCSTCGTTEDLTGDHLRWPARTLKDVDVLCRSCNARKGKPVEEPGGLTLDEPVADPGGKAFSSTQFDNHYRLGGGGHG